MFSMNFGEDVASAADKTTGSEDGKKFSEIYMAATFMMKSVADMRRDGELCDLVLEVGHSQFHVHRLVMCVWSPVMRSLLIHHSGEANPHVCIGYSDTIVFEQFLNYLYTGDVPEQAVNVPAVLLLAASFKVCQLQEYCEELLKSTLSVENMISVYRLAIKFQLKSLGVKCLDFLNDFQHAAEISQTSEFIDLPSGQMNAFIGSELLQHLDPEIKLFLIISWLMKDVSGRQQYLVVLLSHIDWSVIAADFLQEISTTENLFTCNPSCLYLLLQTLSLASISLGPYEDQFEELKGNFDHLLPIASSSDLDLSDLPQSCQHISINVMSHSGQGQTSETGSGVIVTNVNTGDKSVDSGPSTNNFVHERKSKGRCAYNLRHERHVCDTQNLQDVVTTASTSLITPERSFSEIEETNYQRNKNCAHLNSEENHPSLQNKDKWKCFPSSGPNETNSKKSRRLAKSKHDSLSLTLKKTQATKPARDFQFKYILRKRKSEDKGLSSLTRKQTLRSKKQVKTKPAKPHKSAGKRKYRSEVKGNVADDHSENDMPESPKPGKVKEKPTDTTQEKSSIDSKIKEKSGQTEVKHDTLFACDHCLYTTKEEADLARHHTQEHTPGPPHSCGKPTCEFNNLSTMHQVRNRDENGELQPFVCTQCSTAFMSKSALRSHFKTHCDDRNFKCLHCDQQFKQKINLQQHMVVHSEDRPYLCDLCGFSTKYQSHLISHKRIHTGQVFHCDHPSCDYSTPRWSHLEDHKRIHLGLRTHVCSICGKSFVKKSHLVRHERIHAEDTSYPCPDCDYTTTRLDKIKEHIKRRHQSPNEAQDNGSQTTGKGSTNDPSDRPSASGNGDTNDQSDGLATPGTGSTSHKRDSSLKSQSSTPKKTKIKKKGDGQEKPMAVPQVKSCVNDVDLSNDGIVEVVLTGRSLGDISQTYGTHHVASASSNFPVVTSGELKSFNTKDLQHSHPLRSVSSLMPPRNYEYSTITDGSNFETMYHSGPSQDLGNSIPVSKMFGSSELAVTSNEQNNDNTNKRQMGSVSHNSAYSHITSGTNLPPSGNHFTSISTPVLAGSVRHQPQWPYLPAAFSEYPFSQL